MYLYSYLEMESPTCALTTSVLTCHGQGEIDLLVKDHKSILQVYITSHKKFSEQNKRTYKWNLHKPTKESPHNTFILFLHVVPFSNYALCSLVVCTGGL